MTQKITKTAKVDAVELLIGGLNQTQTANTVGVTRETVSRWVNHDPEFRGLMAEAHAGAVTAMHHRLAGLTETAVDTLAAICKSSDKDSDRIAAAKTILDKVAPSAIAPVDEEDFDLRDVLGDQYDTVMDTIADARTDT